MISNTVTIFRTLLTLPLFALLAFAEGDHRWTALALFLGAGALDIVDGILARRLNETSRFGAMIDLVGDRMLTMAAGIGLVAGGGLSASAVIAAVVLVCRCIVVASLNEALPGKLTTRATSIETAKIALSFAGFSLLIAPRFLPDIAGLSQPALGTLVLVVAAAATLVTVVSYWMQGLRAFRAEERDPPL